jgi:hypothetical protein
MSIKHDYVHLPTYSERLKLSTRLFKLLAKARQGFFIIAVGALIVLGESIADSLANWILL